MQWHELEQARTAGASLIDVRSRDEHAAGSIPGAINVPLDDRRECLAELPPGELVVHCQIGLSGHIATRLLTQHGYSVRNLDGGYRTWLAGQRASGEDPPTRP